MCVFFPVRLSLRVWWAGQYSLLWPDNILSYNQMTHSSCNNKVFFFSFGASKYSILFWRRQEATPPFKRISHFFSVPFPWKMFYLKRVAFMCAHQLLQDEDKTLIKIYKFMIYIHIINMYNEIFDYELLWTEWHRVFRFKIDKFVLSPQILTLS